MFAVWEMSGDKDRLLYWPQVHLLTIAVLLSHLSLGCSTGYHWEPKPSIYSWFSLWHPVSNSLEPSGHQVILLSNTHLLLLFFRLFKQAHLLIGWGSIYNSSSINVLRANIVHNHLKMISDSFVSLIEPYIVLPLWGRVDLGVMLMYKWLLHFLKFPEM